MFLMLGAVGLSQAQGYVEPLTMQGVEHASSANATIVAMGGISVGHTEDPSVMFGHPANLTRIDRMRISVGRVDRSIRTSQSQRWYPLRTMPTFSLMMEGLLGGIPDPDYSEAPTEGFGLEDTIGRAHDDILPDWSHEKTHRLPLEVYVAVPLTVGDHRLTIGAGWSEYANLSSFYQNNNVLDPSLGAQRPTGILRPANGQEIPFMWSQRIRSRDGSISGYGLSAGIDLSSTLSAGVSVRLLHGTTDDMEISSSRGKIRIGNNDGSYYYSVDSLHNVSTLNTTSTFSGSEISASFSFRSKDAEFSFSTTLPTTILRDVSGKLTVDSMSVISDRSVTSSDKIFLPLHGWIGLSLDVRQDVTLGLEYGVRPLASAEYTSAGGARTHPWLSYASLRAGAEYRPFDWLSMRAGYRSDAEVFQEEGAPIDGEPVGSRAISFGLGLTLFELQFNVGYKRVEVSYQDSWQTNVNVNRTTFDTFVTGLSYVIP